jgi:alpha-mannosidase
MEFGNPLICRKALTHPGSLPANWGFVELSRPDIVLSAVTADRDGSTLVRVFETAGVAAPQATLKFPGNINSAQEVNLMGDPIRDLKPAGKAVEINLAPYQIKTFRISIASAAG